MYFIVHAAFVRIKLMMMMNIGVRYKYTRLYFHVTSATNGSSLRSLVACLKTPCSKCRQQIILYSVLRDMRKFRSNVSNYCRN